MKLDKNNYNEYLLRAIQNSSGKTKKFYKKCLYAILELDMLSKKKYF